LVVEGSANELAKVVVLLAAGVIGAPLFKRLGLGSVLGYLAAGVVIGPFGFRVFSEPETILHVAELGVVLFLFVIGLEMQPSRLWALRRQILGLGALQVIVCGALLTVAGIAAGFSPVVAFIAAMGFTLTSTAIVVQILEERGESSTPKGQRAISILLLKTSRSCRSSRSSPCSPRFRAWRRPARAGSTSASRSSRSRHWLPPGDGCSTRCSASSPARKRAR
jgi:glutathione-regulated potassium-efflux system protein KefB